MLEEELKIKLTHEIIDPIEFDEIVIDAYNNGNADECLAAYHFFARSGIPAGTAGKRSISHLSGQVPFFKAKNCNGCMNCVNLCPDNAIKVKVIPESEIEDLVDVYIDEDENKQMYYEQFAITDKFYTSAKKKKIEPGKFILAIDPDKCKGCAQCVKVCTESALNIVEKDETHLKILNDIFYYFNKIPETDSIHINGNEHKYALLNPISLLYTGGTCSCKGCGETPAISMMLAATSMLYGKENIGIVNETGCAFEYSLEYPYNPFLVPVVNANKNSINAKAMGIRTRWNQQGWNDKKLWIISRNNGLNERYLNSISFLLKSGLDIKILNLDRNGCKSRSSLICEQFPEIFSAQTSASNIEHFYKTVITANKFEGPVLINVYAACQPEHGIAEDMSYEQARLAVDSRAFPMFIYDPGKGKTFKERLSLHGNHAVKDNWYKDPISGNIIDFIYYSRTENRFSNSFEKDGSPNPELIESQKERLSNWNNLQKLACTK